MKAKRVAIIGAVFIFFIPCFSWAYLLENPETKIVVICRQPEGPCLDDGIVQASDYDVVESLDSLHSGYLEHPLFLG